MAIERAKRVGEQIRKEISDMLLQGIKDPRLGFITITEVKVSGDLRHAKVFVSIFGSEKDKEKSLEGLRSATGFVRREIGKRIRLRYTPEIVFIADDSMERASRIQQLLDKTRE